MSAIYHPQNRPIRWSRALTLWMLTILITASLLLGLRAVLNETRAPGEDAYQADWVPMAQNLVIPIPAPLAPSVESGAVPWSTPAPPQMEAENLAVIAVPVPTPPPHQGS